MENRIYKFRAWDIFSRKFIYSNKQRMDNMGEVGNIDERPFKELSIFFDRIDDEPDRFILMQWTGLKDTNGKEIYEGDILRTQFYFGEYNNQIVKWEEYQYIGIFYYNSSEVIGNIYENPELIKESEGEC